VSRPGEINGIGATRESDNERRKFCKIGEELGFLLLGRERRFIESDLDDRAHEMRKV